MIMQRARALFYSLSAFARHNYQKSLYPILNTGLKNYNICTDMPNSRTGKH